MTHAHTIQLLCDFEFEEHELTQFNYFVNQSGEPALLTTLTTIKVNLLLLCCI